jgi:hypothetical protein
MSLATDRGTLIRLQNDIAALRRQEADQMRKEAEATKKANTAMARATRASSVSSAQSYAREAEREMRRVEDAQAQRAQIAKKIADKSSDVARVQLAIARGEEAEQKKRFADDRKRQQTYDSRIRELERQLTERASNTFIPSLPGDERGIVHDFFISHASEDKEEFVDGLAAKAKEAGLDVFYDRFALEWGANLRQEIDRGLATAFFGIVILSENFFKKPWPQYELDGLIQKDMLGTGRLLPIWHRLTVDDVVKHAPSLAGRLALNTAINSTDEIVAELLKMRDRFRPGAKPGAIQNQN